MRANGEGLRAQDRPEPALTIAWALHPASPKLAKSQEILARFAWGVVYPRIVSTDVNHFIGTICFPSLARRA
jgi:hypothetical protein